MATPRDAGRPLSDDAAPASGRHAFLLEADSDVRLDSLVAARLSTSRTRAATLIATGHVTVAGRREKASYRPTAGDEVVVDVPEPPGREVVGEDIPLTIVHEDDDLLVVDKPAGMVVHPAPGNWSGTLVNALKGRGGGSVLDDEDADARAGIVHRLDKDTSGLLLVAKRDRAHRILSAALAARQVVRRYAVLALGHLANDRLTIERPIARDPRDRKRMAVVSSGRAARTDFVRLGRFDGADLLRAHLHTGRTHQIRVHLASVGHPVVGDDTYGGGARRRGGAAVAPRQFLHAARLVFRHPTSGATIDLRSPLPPDLRPVLERVGGGPEAFPSDSDPLEYFGFFRDDPPS